jgi:hypothetical protein
MDDYKYLCCFPYKGCSGYQLNLVAYILIVLIFSMERKNMEKGVAVRSQLQKGKKKKKLGVSASQSRDTTGLRKAKTKRLPASPCSSDEIDEDYAEFLKTYDPQEFYPRAPSFGGEAESGLTIDTQEGMAKTAEAKDGGCHA